MALSPRTRHDPAKDHSPHRDTPPGVFALTPVDGRSPDSRVIAERRLPGYPVADWREACRLQLRGTVTALVFQPHRVPY